MAHDKLAYWKERMQDRLHQVDDIITDRQNIIIEHASHMNLEFRDIVLGFQKIREGMIDVAKAIENAQPRKQQIRVVPPAGQEETHANTPSK